ncbi:hypothetical protein D3C75_670250 [compost metagenome]
MSAKFPFCAYLPCHGGYLVRESSQRLDHIVDCIRQLGDFAFGFHSQFLLQVTVRYRRYDLGDSAHLIRQVGRHNINVVGEVFPDPPHTADLGLSAQFTVRTNLTRHTRNLRGERIQLIHHRIDCVLQL